MKRILAIALAATMTLWAIPASARGGSHSGSSGYHYVRPHVTKSGKLVTGHYQTNPNKTKRDNWSTKGNVNPFTGKAGTKNP